MSHVTRILAKAERLGRDAARNGLPLTANPYPAPVKGKRMSFKFDEMDACHRAWNYGFNLVMEKRQS